MVTARRDKPDLDVADRGNPGQSDGKTFRVESRDAASYFWFANVIDPVGCAKNYARERSVPRPKVGTIRALTPTH